METRYYRCCHKAILTTRNGAPMLAARLRDAHGAVRAVAFDQIDHLADAFDPGDVVRTIGRLGTYRGKPNLRLESIQCLRSAPPAAIVPTTNRDLECFAGMVEHFRREITDPAFGRLLEASFRAASGWNHAPATTFSHHAYVGGLLEHTAAVAAIADELCSLHPSIDRELLLTAALLHDLGRSKVYPRDDRWRAPGRDPIEATLRLVGDAARATRLPGAHWLALAGCIAFGAARTNDEQGPTVEATALRCADILDSTVGDAKRRQAPIAVLEQHRQAPRHAPERDLRAA
jgi:3'-5' exoribonuclease